MMQTKLQTWEISSYWCFQHFWLSHNLTAQPSYALWISKTVQLEGHLVIRELHSLYCREPLQPAKKVLQASADTLQAIGCSLLLKQFIPLYKHSSYLEVPVYI